MKILIDTDLLTDDVTAYTASSSDASYPAANMRDNYPGNVWKAASGTTATIKLNVSDGSAVALFNINATDVKIFYGTGDSYVNESGFANESGYAYSPIDPSAILKSFNLSGTAGKVWAEYPYQAGETYIYESGYSNESGYANSGSDHVVTILLTATGVPSVGIVRAGKVEEFRNPGYGGMAEGSVDYSIQAQMPNGANYFRKRSVVRTHSGLSMLETRANAFIFKHDIFDAVGPMPLPVRITADSVTDDEFIVFAKRTAPVGIEHVTTDYTRINFGLMEVA